MDGAPAGVGSPEGASATAVIGVSCRFPGAADPQAYWALLCEGRDAIGDVPAGRLALAGISQETDLADVPWARIGGFVEDVDHFDARFFGISPREADAMDPEQRMALELGWAALEDAGIAPLPMAEAAVGVFVGATGGDYPVLADRLGARSTDRHAMTGLSRGLIANRVSYALGLTGPSMTVDAAQASSLAAVHLACESIRDGGSLLALAGGVHLNLDPLGAEAAHLLGALSPDGRCHTFDARADGYARGEGGGFVVLKRLDAAREDGDRIYCVIRGSAVNNDGATDGLTVPRAAAQAEVIRASLRRAGLGPADVDYVELHGTGTPVGDPVEAAALGQALGAGRRATTALRVGSVKTNIGHLEAAAGIAGLIKTALAIRHEEVPASLNFSRANPEIPLEELGLAVQRELGPWPGDGTLPVAGVSSFGIGGTNCHVVLTGEPEDNVTTPEPVPSSGSSPPTLLPLSAKSEQGLRDQAALVSRQLREDPDLSPEDLSFSLATTRTAFPVRSVAIGSDRRELLAGLDAVAGGERGRQTVGGSASVVQRPVFLFPGQGHQWPGMAADLLEESPLFAEPIAACEEAFAPFVEWSLTEVLADRQGAGIEETEIVQPALFAVMVSLARLWEAHGVRPAAVLGHSQGEVAAAHVAGALTLEDAARVVCLRAHHLGRIGGQGRMVALSATPADVEELLRPYRGEASVAAINGPGSVVVSGTSAATAALSEACAESGVRTREVAVDYAGHSAQVEAVRKDLLASFAPVAPRSCDVPFYSTVAGGLLDTAVLDGGYWYANARETVRFEEGVAAMIEDGRRLFLEIGAHPVLGLPLGETAEAVLPETDRVRSLLTLQREEGGIRRFALSLAGAHCQGAEVDWGRLFSGRGRRRVELPTYPFQRRPHWLRSGGPRREGHVPGRPPGAREPVAETVGLEEWGPRALLDLVLTETADVLGLEREEVDPVRPFKEVGLDSLGAVELRDRLRAATRLALPRSVVFDHPNPTALATRLSTPADTVDAPGDTAPRPSVAVEEPIAIIGMACRLPGGVADPEGLWRLVAAGDDAVSPFPGDRGWDLDRLLGEEERIGTSAADAGGFLADAGGFDADFFGISPREALAMDPQQRHLLEASWEALESAGISPTSLADTATGVFVGAGGQDYTAGLRAVARELEGFLLTGSSPSVIAGRVSYFLGLRGQAMSLDTACSSSLVALHVAARALRSGECTMALAGGATVLGSPGIFTEFSRQGGLAPDGRSKSFSAAADGVGWAEGVGMVVLERLSAARASGHEVLATIRGSAVNQDGASNGLTAPNGPSQEEVIRQALADAGLTAADVDAVEAHGTGTVLGDPIEAGALISTYGRERGERGPLALGSLKSNIGHTQAAAGVAGVIKMVMALRHEQLPRTLHAEMPSPHIDWEAGEVELLGEPREWRRDGRPRRAGVSSFGISGTNAHLILEEAPEPARACGESGAAALAPVPLLVSARSPEALEACAARLAERIEGDADLGLGDLGYSLATTRAHLPHRAVALVGDREEGLRAMLALAAGGTDPSLIGPRDTDLGRLAYLFPGQGAQRPGMGAELADSWPVYAATLEEICGLLAAELDGPLPEVVLRGPGEQLDQTTYAQPALFATGVALFRLLESFGLRPDLLAGHSIGEIAAAHVSGVLGLPDACRLVAARARLMGALPGGGAMVALEGTEDELATPIAEAGLSLAAVNSPLSVVASGDEEAVEALRERWADTGRRTSRLAVSHAFHSHLMAPMLEEFGEVARSLTYSEPQIPIVSTIDGDLLGRRATDPAHWVAQVREPVRFAAAVDGLLDAGATALLELGPDPVLSAAASLCPGAEDVPSVAIMRRGSPERETLAAALATAHAKGATVDWEAFFDGSGARPVALPTYAFQRRHYWLGSDAGTAGDLRSVGQGSPRYPLLGATIAPADGAGRIFTGRLAADRPSWLADHALLGSVVVPGAAFVEMALEAGREVGCATVEELVMEAPLVLPGRGGVQLQVLVEAPDQEGRHAFGIHSRPEGCAEGDPWARHAAGVLAEPEAPELPGLDLEAWPPPGSERMDPADFYRHMAGLGWDYGRSFTGIRTIWRRGDDLFAELELSDEEQAEAAEFVVHPALLDLGVQLIVAGASWSAADTLRMPFGFDGVRVDVSGARRLRARIGTGEGAGSLLAVNDEGRPVISIRSLSLRPVSQDRLAEARRAVAPDAAGLFVVGWTPAPEALATLEGREGSRRRTVTVEIHPGRDTEDGVSTAPAEALAAVQGWLADGGADDGRLVVVTQGAAAVTEDDGPAELGSAAAWALLRAAQAEYPGRVRLIDLDGAEASDAALHVALAGDEPQLAIRAGVAYVPLLARADAPATDPVAVDLGEGTVLVTGGTGDLGALLARHLVAAHGVRRLLLASRSGPDAPGAAELRAELETMGAEVTVAACDVGDREAVAALLDSIPAVDPLRAVVHAAGVVEDGTVATLDEGRLLRVLGPKAEAAVHLHELTAGLDLAAFVLFSSATATLGSAGQGNYAAANAVLDVLAARRRREGLPATAIAWGRWSQEAGMAAGLAAADRGRIERTGIGSVGRSEGLELFDAALARPEPHLVAMSIDPGSLRRASRDGGLSPLMAGLLADEPAGNPDASPAPSPPAPFLAGLPAEDREDAVLGEVLTAVAGVLGYGAGERVAPRRTFNDLGLDSLTGLELRNRLATISGLRLPSTLVFDHPTPAAIAHHIAAEIGGSSETPEARAAGAPTPAAPTRPTASDEPIAVLGMGCRFPGGVAGAEDLWRLAAAEVDAMSPFPDDRGWDLERLFDDPGRPGTSHAREGGFLDEMADFDADFFGISPREALAMDPQQRLLLETSWEALEQAGIDPELLHGSRTGVFVGVTPFEFGAGLWSAPEGREHLAGYWLTGTIGSVCSGRISYTYGLEGPSSSVDTACSSALVAIHQAAQALRAGECPLALAAGVTVLDSPGLFVQFSSQRGLARDGRCKSFAEAADGVGWGEGGGVIVLERLVDAERNGHPVLAVLRGSAVNQDGASNGLSAPNGPSQQRVIEQALANSGLGAADVDAVEAHGTGTRLGDPIEAGALLATYGRDRGARGPLLIGSVKSNIGHTGAAAGIAGVIKMVKALEHGQLPATLHVDRPSTKVDWEAGEVDLLTEKRPWPAGGQVRRAGVSAFGVSGTNAHLILEEAPAAASAGSGPEPPGAGVMPWVLSAKSEDALREQAGRLGRYLADAGEEPRPEVIARTLSARPSLEYRAVVLGADGGRRDAPVAALAAGGTDRRLLRGVAAASGPPGLAFLFTGQGAQRPGMGRELHEAFPVFADAFDAVATRLEEHLDRSLWPVVFGGDGALPGALDRTAFTQAGLFALEVAMFRLLESWGVRPDFLLGHSIGELAAAHVAGVFSLEDGCRLVAARGRLMQALPAGGAMLAVEATEAEARAAMGSLADPASRVALAAVNGPRATVVSGDEDAVAELEALWRDEGRRLRRLNVSHAFHSPRMDPMLDELRAVAAGLEYAAPRIPIVSDLTGRPTAEELCDPDYWVRQAREPVRFGDGVEWLLEAGVSAFLELGPDGVLSATAMARVAEEPVDRAPIAVPIVRGGEDEVEASFRAVAELWAGGVTVDWTAVCGPATGRLPELPTYPFRRQRYWLEATSTPGDLRAAGLEETGHPLLGATIESPEGGLMMMSGAISLGSRRWLADHVVGGRAILPGSVFLELALAAGERCGAPCVEELTMEAPLPLPERGVVAVRVSVAAPDEAGRRAIGIHSRSAAEDGEDGDWVRHAEGALVVDVPDARLEPMTEWPPAGAEALDLDDFYDSLADAGFLYGPAFQGVRRAWRSPDGDVCAEVSLAQDQAQEAGDYRIHPALLDAALHPSLLGPDGEPRPRLPFSWHGIAVGREEHPASLRVSLGLCAEDQIDLRLGDGRGRPLVAGRLATRPPDPRRLEGRAETRSLLRVDWIAQPLATGVGERPTVVELETVGAPDPAAAAQESAAAALALVQRSIAEGASGPPLFILTRGAVAASEDERPDLAAASAWGLIGSAQSEHPGRFVLIDHDGSEASAAALPALGQLLEAGETRLALREGRALAPRLTRIEAVGQAAPLDPARTVLLTGATGGLGPVFARHLVEAHGARHLLLLSRSGPEAPGAARLVEDLGALGAEVEVVACDVGDREDLEGVLGGIDAGRPPGAVFHAAGVLDDGVVASLTPDRIGRVLAPKARGAWNLHELTKDLDLTHFVLFSSAAATLGTPGQANYAAANAFLEAMALRRRSEQLPGTAIAWGLWAPESGMSARMGGADMARMERSGFEPIAEERGIELFDASLSVAEPRVLAVPLRRSRLRSLAAGGLLPPLLRGLVRPSAWRRPAAGSLASTLAEQPAGQRPATVLRLVGEEVAAVLGHDSPAAIEPRRAFKEMGFDSLAAVELRNRLAAATGLTLAPTLVFDHPDPTALAEHLRAEAEGEEEEQQPARAPVAARAPEEPVAIVGMSCRYPGGVDSPDDLWRLLAGRGDAIGPFPGDRGWDLSRLFDPDPEKPGTTYVEEGGFLERAADFDADFFGISPREALAMDPQQRLLLEASWEALEDAGIDPASLRGSDSGVWAGVMHHDYTVGRGSAEQTDGFAHGVAGSVATGRVAYSLGLTGPAVTLDTACSSSLVALHQAAAALRSGECGLALAGGVTVLSTPTVFTDFARQRGLAPDGRSKSFAAAADGVGWSEGVGVVVLELLADARRNGHTVLATIRGSAVNQDGASNGLTAPSGRAQRSVIETALAGAGLTTADVDAVEAHGTGTTLGDPIEAGALLATYGADRGGRGPLRLGSIKSNIGHTQAAAGVAGVIKLVEALRHEELPATIHLDRPSPEVDWESGEVELLDESAPWPRMPGSPRRAAVSSFGISGTNAHLIIEEAPEPGPLREEAPPAPLVGALVLPLSARGEGALRDMAADLAGHLRTHPEVDAGDISFSLATGRAVLPHRAVVGGGGREDLLAGLDALTRGEEAAGLTTGRSRGNSGPVFLLTGQGAQRATMGTGLRAASPVFAAAFDEICSAFDPMLPRPLAEVIEEGGEALDDTTFTQPAMFAVEVALARLLGDLGIRPAAMVGHSVGELAAAHLASVLSLVDACTLVAARGRLMGALPAGGAMVAIEAGEGEVAEALEGHDDVGIAAVNGPGAVVVSGPEAAVMAVKAGFDDVGNRTKRLAVSHAFHSSLIDPVLEELEDVARELELSPPRIPILSTLTGRVLSTDEATDPSYWARQARSTVRFADAVTGAAELGHRLYVELGPDPVLCAAAAGCLDPTAQLIPTLRGGREEAEALIDALARAHCAGAEVDWAGLVPGARRVPLPTYPFQRRRYWLEPWAGGDPAAVGQSAVEHPFLGAAVELPGEGWLLTGRISLDAHPWLADHAVLGTPILPATALLDLALRSGEEAGLAVLRELTLLAPVVVSEHGSVALQARVGPPGEDRSRPVALASRRDGDEGWTTNATGTLESGVSPPRASEAAWPAEGAEAVDLDGVYALLAAAGFEYGPAFRRAVAAWRRDDEVFVEVAVDERLGGRTFAVHPALLDSAFHPALGLADLGRGEVDAPWLPFSIRGVRRGAGGARMLRVTIREGESVGEISLEASGGQGEPVLRIDSLLTRPVDPAALKDPGLARSMYSLDWQAPAPGLAAPSTVSGAVLLDLTCGGSEPSAAHSSVVALLPELQAFLASEAQADSRLVVLTRGALAVRGGEVPDPAMAAALGLLGSAASEHPGRFAHIDLDAMSADVPPTALALTGAEPRLALREGRLLVPRLRRAEEPRERLAPVDPVRTVLITGAPGALGSSVARHLIEDGARHVVLASRRGPGAEAAGELRDELVALGAEVEIQAADVCDREAVEALVAGIGDGHPLGTVIHCAGILEDATLAGLDPDRIERVLAPKVDGAWNLHRATAGLDLERFVLFSSVAGVLGSPGQGAYAAANSYLDALAQVRRAEGLPASSIAWGLWDEESGMTPEGLDGEGRLRKIEQIRVRLGLALLAPADGLALLDACLSRPDPVIFPAPLDRAALASLAALGTEPSVLRGLAGRGTPGAADVGPGASSDVAPASTRGDLAARLAEVPEDGREAVAVALVNEHVAAVLGHASAEAVDPDRAFKDLGFDSLAAVELRNRLSAASGLRLPVGLVFDHPSVSEAARALVSLCGRGGGAEADVDEGLPGVEAIAEMDDEELVRLAYASRRQT